MKYKDYEGFTKTYVVVHSTGTGVIEDPFVELNVAYETNDLDKAISEVNRLETYNNSPAAIASSWYSNRYNVNVNTLTDKGKELIKTFKDTFNEKLSKLKESGNYKKIESDNCTFYVQNSNW